MRLIASGMLRDGRCFNADEEFNTTGELTKLMRDLRLHTRVANIEVRGIDADVAEVAMAEGVEGSWHQGVCAHEHGRLIRLTTDGGRA